MWRKSQGRTGKDTRAWDAASLINGIYVLADVAAVALPFVPAIAGVRHIGKVDDVVDLAKGVDKVADAADAAKAVDKVADAGKGANKAESAKGAGGIYEAVTTSGESYIGQSGNAPARLQQHVKSGKITTEAAQKATVQSIPGGKTAREVAEQKLIIKRGGVDNLANKRNPIGPKRQSLIEPEGH